MSATALVLLYDLTALALLYDLNSNPWGTQNLLMQFCRKWSSLDQMRKLLMTAGLPRLEAL